MFEESVRFSIDLPRDVHLALRRKALESGSPAAAIVRELVVGWVGRQGAAHAAREVPDHIETGPQDYGEALAEEFSQPAMDSLVRAAQIAALREKVPTVPAGQVGRPGALGSFDPDAEEAE